MVLRACRSALNDEHDAQDAFQATFLILARRAGSLWVRDSLGPWLHAVAMRVSRCARSAAKRRRAHERRAAELAAGGTIHGDFHDDFGAILHEEIGRLPERYRVAIVLCDLQGLSHSEASQRLRWPLGTVKSRQSRGRERLRARLVRRGLAPSLGVLISWLSAEQASATVPPALLELTARMAFRAAKGPWAVGVVPAAVALLETQAGHAMWLLNMKVAGAVVLSVGVAVVGAAAVAQQAKSPAPVAAKGGSGPQPVRDADLVNPPVAGAEVGRGKLEDAEALADKLEGARIDVELLEAEAEYLKSMLRRAQDNWMNLAHSEPRDQTPETIKDKAEYELDLRKKVDKLRGEYRAKLTEVRQAKTRKFEVETQAGVLKPPAASGREAPSPADIASRLTETERKLDRILAAVERINAGGPGRFEGGGGGAVEKEPEPKLPAVVAMEIETRNHLAKPISLRFEKETPLSDVLKYVRQATAGPKDSGLHIYIDPVGLKEANATMESTIIINLVEGVPLQVSLRLILAQRKLAYAVKDGLVLISKEGADILKGD